MELFGKLGRGEGALLVVTREAGEEREKREFGVDYFVRISLKTRRIVVVLSLGRCKQAMPAPPFTMIVSCSQEN